MPDADPAFEEALADRLHAALEGVSSLSAVRRLRIRMAELDPNSLDEVRQYRQLQRAVREEPALQDALDGLGWPDVAERHPVTDPSVGPLVQAFNRMIEEHWNG
jgi:hypothetical protein